MLKLELSALFKYNMKVNDSCSLLSEDVVGFR